MAKVQAARFEPSFWDAVYDRYVNSGVEKVHLFAQRDAFGDVVFTKSSLDKSRAVGIDCSFASLIIIKNSLKELTHVDKHEILESLCDRLYGAIRNGTAIVNPSFVLPSAIIVYVDVKKFKYHFWSCCLTARIPRGVKPLTGPVEPLSRDRIVSIYVALARFVLMHQQECSDFAWCNESRALLLPPIMGLRKKSVVGEGEAGSAEWEVHLLEEIWDARYDPDVYLVLSGGNEKGHAELPAYASNVLALLWHTRDITGVGAENEKGDDWEGHTEAKEDPLAAAEDIHHQGLSTTSAVSEGKVVKLVCLRGKIIDALWDSGVGADEQRQVAQAKYLIRVLEPEQQQVSLGDRSIVHSFRLEDLEETAECFEQCKAYLKVAGCPGANAQAVMTAKEQEHYSHFDVDKYSDLVIAVDNLLQGDLALRSACDRRDCAIPQANKGTIGDGELVRAWNDVAKAERALLEAHETVAREVDRALERPDADSLQLERKEARGWDFEGDPARCSALQPLSVDHGSDRSPELLLTQASQLNLSLMKWREWPRLSLEELQKRSCLLLGSGTLGCAVARCLLAWGFGSITLIDNGRVSFSNPTRQSLFQLDDCYGGERDLPQDSSGGADVNYGGGGSETLGKLKAAAARDALHRIDPNADVHGIELEIPSPGCLQGVSPDRIHAATGEVVTSTLQLMHFVATNDIIFSLLDTREARWLPTLLTAAAVATEESKTMITAAIGFDSYLVMRHSGNTDEDLGCYFCSDITSGGGGTPPSERPLDQQCSVTRPGLSGIVGGLAVEMAVQIVQARARQDGQRDDRSSDAMSEIPHQIRGSLRDWNQTCHTVPRFNKCIACSQGVVQNFLGKGAPSSAGGDAHSRVLSSRVDFVTDVCRDPQVLPVISGLDGLLREAEHEMSSVLLDSDND